MKKLIILIMLFSLVCCVPDEEKQYDYSIVNNSGVTVEIIPYIVGVKQLNDRVVLQNNQIFNKKITTYGAGGYNMASLLKTITNARGPLTDIEFVFSNSKKIIYQECTATNQCFNQARNIFNPTFSSELREVYTITSEDFQNAIDCGGNCN